MKSAKKSPPSKTRLLEDFDGDKAMAVLFDKPSRGSVKWKGSSNESQAVKGRMSPDQSESASEFDIYFPPAL